MPLKKKKNIAIVLSAGLSLRFKKNNHRPPKQLVKINGKTLIEHTLLKFEKNKKIDEIILVVNQESQKAQKKIVQKGGFKKIKKVILGGNTRQESSRNGVLACDQKKTNKVLIHDANRPFVSDELINKTLKALDNYRAVTIGTPLVETILKVNSKNLIVGIPPRADFCCEQTPQGFRYEIIKKAHELADRNHFKEATDDCSLVEKYRLTKIFVIPGEEENIKITYPLDLFLARQLFRLKRL